MGLESSVTILESYLVKSVLNTSFLLLGEKGNGNSFLGRCFAAEILDSDRVFRNVHPDFFFRKITSSAAVDTIEEAHNFAYKKPFEAKRVVVFLDDVHLMNPDYGNKLLKVIEEPPQYTTFILTATTKESVLDTISSRCHKVILPQLTNKDKAHILTIHGIKNPEERLSITRNLRTCMSSEFDSVKEWTENCRATFLDLIYSSDKDYYKKLDESLTTVKDHKEFMKALVGMTPCTCFNQYLYEVISTASFNSSLSLFDLIATSRKKYREDLRGCKRVKKESETPAPNN